MGFVSFMAGPAGRITRMLAGLVFIGVGIVVILGSENSLVGIILAIVGLVPLMAGAFDFCLIAPLFGAPLSGAKIRARLHATG